MSADRRRELEALLRKHGKSSDEEDQLSSTTWPGDGSPDVKTVDHAQQHVR